MAKGSATCAVHFEEDVPLASQERCSYHIYIIYIKQIEGFLHVCHQPVHFFDRVIESLEEDTNRSCRVFSRIG